MKASVIALLVLSNGQAVGLHMPSQTVCEEFTASIAHTLKSADCVTVYEYETGDYFPPII